ncbi:MAG: aminotransferase class III-fold pyridoxal phosphate-dependent enzyme, partial [Burkholderiaceae bacterium]
IAAGSGYFQHGHTYLAHPVACAAALATVNEIESRGLLAQVQSRGDYLRRALDERLGTHPNVGDIRGRGLFVGIELVADRQTKAPLPVGQRTHAKIRQAAMRAGLLVYPMGGTIDGERGDHVLIAPPYIIEQAQIDELVERLDTALQAVLPRAVSA